MKVDCLIVGGGVMGMMTALELQQAGMKVAVVEQGRLGREASWASGGILSPMYAWQQSEPVTRLSLWSAKEYPRIAEHLKEETSIDPEWIQCGMLYFDIDEADKVLDWSKHHDVLVDIIPGEDIHRAEPPLQLVHKQGIWFPDRAQIRPPRLMKSLRKSLACREITTYEDQIVTEIVVDRDSVKGVKTKDQVLHSDTVVITAGAWSPQILNALGVSIPVVPVRGQMILYRASRVSLTRMVLYQDRYLIPRKDGRILAGSTMEHSGFDSNTTEEGVESLIHSSVHLLPDLKDCPIEHQWAGLRPGKADGIPIISEHPIIQGLYVNTGHFRCGIILAPASARLLGDLVLQRTPTFDPTPFRLL